VDKTSFCTSIGLEAVGETGRWGGTNTSFWMYGIGTSAYPRAAVVHWRKFLEPLIRQGMHELRLVASEALVCLRKKVGTDIRSVLSASDRTEADRLLRLRFEKYRLSAPQLAE